MKIDLVFDESTRDGQQIPYTQFAGVVKGSEVYLKSDLLSLIELSDALHQGKEKRRGVARTA